MKEKDPFKIWLLVLILIFTVFQPFFVNGVERAPHLFNFNPKRIAVHSYFTVMPLSYLQKPGAKL
ncbi:hypothetical protein KKA14_08620 [bacterium]|nr:hypothetical protein [bacterium]